MAQGGESGDTFHATLAYIKTHQPTIVILENVLGAPWDDAQNIPKAMKKAAATSAKKEVKALLAEMKKDNPKVKKVPDARRDEIRKRCSDEVTLKDIERGIDWHLKQIDYESTYLIVDTKNYYIPQTRQRGYMVAVSVEAYRNAFPEMSDEEVSKEIKTALDKWKGLMKKLENKASVPVDAMLVAAEDDARSGVSRVEEVDSEDKKVTSWVRCKVLHQQYRMICKFGDEHKLTFWCDNGFRKNPDHWTYLKGLTDRVADTLDISHSRGIVRGWDDRYHR